MGSGADDRRPGAGLVHPRPAGCSGAATSFLTHPGLGEKEARVTGLRGDEKEPELPADHTAT